jgi:hypothetical protein
MALQGKANSVKSYRSKNDFHFLIKKAGFAQATRVA